MSNIAEKLTTIAENQQKLYDKGMSDNESVLWDGVLWDGARTTYMQYLFAYWKNEYIRPKYKIVPTASVDHMFYKCKSLKKIEAEYFDFSNVPYVSNVLSTSGFGATFNSCENLVEIEDVNLSAANYYQAFAYCYDLEKIANINSQKDSNFTQAFHNCGALKEIRFTGVIGNDLNFAVSPLSLDSVNSIVEHLYKYSSGSHVLTFSDYTKTLLTDEIKTEITGKGWSYV